MVVDDQLKSKLPESVSRLVQYSLGRFTDNQRDKVIKRIKIESYEKSLGIHNTRNLRQYSSSIRHECSRKRCGIYLEIDIHYLYDFNKTCVDKYKVEIPVESIVSKIVNQNSNDDFNSVFTHVTNSIMARMHLFYLFEILYKISPNNTYDAYRIREWTSINMMYVVSELSFDTDTDMISCMIGSRLINKDEMLCACDKLNLIELKAVIIRCMYELEAIKESWHMRL